MRVLGVDPGSAVCGYGVVEGRAGGNPQFVAAGTIRSAMLAAGPKRLHRIHENLLEIIDQFTPDSLSLERHFVDFHSAHVRQEAARRHHREDQRRRAETERDHQRRHRDKRAGRSTAPRALA